jgi:hypothetical protein
MLIWMLGFQWLKTRMLESLKLSQQWNIFKGWYATLSTWDMRNELSNL